jgi:hypothetical protein
MGCRLRNSKTVHSGKEVRFRNFKAVLCSQCSSDSVIVEHLVLNVLGRAGQVKDNGEAGAGE